MNIKTVKIKNPENLNVIFGQAHFIKTVEDLYESLVEAVPGIKFGLAFCESSGPCLVRTAGTNEELIKLAQENALKISCGHTFLIFLKDAFPINVLNQIKMLPEVCQIFCATANPVEVVMTKTEKGGGVLGVINGLSPKGIEKKKDIKERKEFLRKIGYKL